MEESGGAPGGRGRLHGRLLQVLGGVSAVAVVVALWQFGVFGSGPERDAVNVAEDLESLSIPEGVSESGSASAQASSAAVESPSASSAAPSTAAAVSESPSSAVPSAPVETSAAVEEGGSAACTASLTVAQEWEDSVEVTVEVVNAGSVALEAWEVDLDLRDVSIYNHWNMRELDRGWYGNEDWNARLDPGEDAVAGFQAEVDDGAEVPGSVSCSARS
ncbi:cellulose binding domain-containing protein [Glycomyces sp. NPDC048151]|uniref:cellulose binding domain-containing protein n=1 Tax=Glycomyces sp. NPDC048151 TaxID=3364002 RepID=UPI003711AE59